MSNKKEGKPIQGALLSWSLMWSNGAPSCLHFWGLSPHGVKEDHFLAPDTNWSSVAPGVWTSNIQVCSPARMVKLMVVTAEALGQGKQTHVCFWQDWVTVSSGIEGIWWKNLTLSDWLVSLRDVCPIVGWFCVQVTGTRSVKQLLDWSWWDGSHAVEAMQTLCPSCKSWSS